MTAAYYNVSFGNGLEGIVNFSNWLVNWWLVPVFAIFIFIAIAVTMSKREDKQYPMSAILAYSLFGVFIVVVIFKLMTNVQEYLIYVVGVALALAIAWGIWQTR